MIYSIKTIQVDQQVTYDVKCDNCETLLKPVVPHTKYQFFDALNITFDGGYGMYYDSMGYEPDLESFLFCKECADRLFEAFPVFRDSINQL